ncbi:unnamed protein product [Rodentolepis nana]|uniref:DUF4064 domain-containing protein n=1 Tax=Rodentolepis nana TaxID=102285 RepID=A0A0R3TGC3_RODNA|nr:unnamed protein product [Rodentolepis nana]
MPQKRNFQGFFRFFLIIFGYAIYVSGVLLLGYGSFLLHEEITEGLMESAPSLEAFMILIGACLLVAAIVGCVGAFRGNQTVNLVFSVVMLILILSGIIVGAVLIQSSKEVFDLQ